MNCGQKANEWQTSKKAPWAVDSETKIEGSQTKRLSESIRMTLKLGTDHGSSLKLHSAVEPFRSPHPKQLGRGYDVVP
jgi:hypothetical protein